MSKPPRRQTETSPAVVDPRENPGSYIRQPDGSFIQDETVAMTVQADGPSAAAPAPVLPAESAAAIAAALADVGHDAPPAVEAAQTAPVAPPAPEVTTETGAGSSTQSPET